MGFVEDNHGCAMLGGAEVVQRRADARDQAWFAERWLDAELQQEIAIQTGDAGGRIGEIHDEIAIEVESGRKGAHGRGLAGTDLTGDETEAPLADEIGQACAEFLLTGGGKQVWGGDGAGKGWAGEAVKFLEHVRPPVRGQRACPSRGRTTG